MRDNFQIIQEKQTEIRANYESIQNQAKNLTLKQDTLTKFDRMLTDKQSNLRASTSEKEKEFEVNQRELRQIEKRLKQQQQSINCKERDFQMQLQQLQQQKLQFEKDRQNIMSQINKQRKEDIQTIALKQKDLNDKQQSIQEKIISLTEEEKKINKILFQERKKLKKKEIELENKERNLEDQRMNLQNNVESARFRLKQIDIDKVQPSLSENLSKIQQPKSCKNIDISFRSQGGGGPGLLSSFNSKIQHKKNKMKKIGDQVTEFRKVLNQFDFQKKCILSREEEEEEVEEEEQSYCQVESEVDMDSLHGQQKKRFIGTQLDPQMSQNYPNKSKQQMLDSMIVVNSPHSTNSRIQNQPLECSISPLREHFPQQTQAATFLQSSTKKQSKYDLSLKQNLRNLMNGAILQKNGEQGLRQQNHCTGKDYHNHTHKPSQTVTFRSPLIPAIDRNYNSRAPSSSSSSFIQTNTLSTARLGQSYRVSSKVSQYDLPLTQREDKGEELKYKNQQKYYQ